MNNIELLMADISARLPYNAKVIVNGHEGTYTVTEIANDGRLVLLDSSNSKCYTSIRNVKPYLFPLSSMTRKQKEEMFDAMGMEEDNPVLTSSHQLDWLLINGFDIRGLIKKELAINALNYKAL